jgi:hypothetical protein
MITATHYDPVSGAFWRTFNIRFNHGGLTYEVPLMALTWKHAEDMLEAIKADGIIHNETIEEHPA